MRIAGINKNDVINGEGICVALFTQGCPHHCKGCFNPETWDYDGGKEVFIYDLISEDWSVRYFICIMKDKSRVTAIGNCDEGNNGEVSVNLFFEHDDEKYYIDDIVWWKEIVLPLEEK